jgi:amidase
MSDISRRDFVAATAALSAASSLPLRGLERLTRHAELPAPPLAERSIAELSAMLARGEITSRALTQQYLDRIAEMDHSGPSLHAIIETNPDALTIADARDAELKNRRLKGPLHGIPVLVKDNIDTADRMTTTAGSLALEGSIASRDAHIVTRLRDAGAIILGKANLSEWANFRSTHSSSGWSGRGGQARNPYALDRTPSGSSSGSGVAVASNFCPVAVGSETDGSITSPSAAMSLVGIKPTIGLVSRSGIIPIAHTQDTAGPMARSVADAAVLLSVLASPDDRDLATAQKHDTNIDYTRYLDAGGLKGARIGVARKKFTGYSPATDAVFETALKAMKDAGAIIVDPADIETAGKFDDAEFEVLLYEFKTDLEKYLSGLGPGARARTMKDLIAFDNAHASTEMPYFGQEIFEQAEKKGPLTDAAYRKALKTCRDLSRTQGLDATFAKYKLDSIVAPTQGPPALIDLVNGDPSGGSSTTPCAVAGYPAITVPMGYFRGLPLGITFMGRAFDEGRLIKYAFAYEQATKVRVPPRFLATATL